MVKPPVHNQAGSSLVELVVGSAIALIALGAVVGLQISAYRHQSADESRYEVQMEAANGLERIVQDIRSASSVSPPGPGCDGGLEVTVDGIVIRYDRDTARAQVVRTEQGRSQVIGRQVECLRFSRPPDAGDSIEMEWTGTPMQGPAFTLRSRAYPRVRSTNAS